MKKIIIKPFNCSRDEYEELLKYLKDNYWDFEQVEDDLFELTLEGIKSFTDKA